MRIRPAGERGLTSLGWLESRHTFSFNRYYDPRHMGFRSLRVINDDWIAPGGKFGRHPHQDMEILTWVIEGAVGHEDSTGAGGEIRAGEAQRMSAGSGIHHSEANASGQHPLRLLQIWILPASLGLEPGYEQRAFPEAERRNRLRLVAAPGGEDGSLRIAQDARVWATLLDQGTAVEHVLAAGRAAWLQVARGVVELNGQRLEEGDGASTDEAGLLRIQAIEPAEALLFDLG